MKFVIVEDETAALVNLKALLRETFPGAALIASLESIAETVDWFSANTAPDIVFMDIHLADGDAFQIFDRVEIKCPIVFTTAYDQYALDAFRVNSIDYLLKPIKAEDLRRAVDKLKRLSGTDQNEYSQRIKDVATARTVQTFIVHIKDKMIPLRTENISYCYSTNEKVSVCTLTGEIFPLDKSLETINSGMPEERFFRANRQFIISRDVIKDISVWFGNRLCVNLTVETPERVIISKARVPEFKRWLVGG